MGSCIPTVIMKCLILLAAMSCVLGDAEPSANPQYFGGNPLLYGGGVPYHGGGVPYQGYGGGVPYGLGMACPHLLDIQVMDIILPTLAMLTQHMELLETMEQLDGHLQPQLQRKQNEG